MKKSIYLFLICFMALSGYAQNYWNHAAQISNSSGKYIIHPEMNQYTIASNLQSEAATFINTYVSDPSPSYDMTILGMDNYGDKIWETVIEDFVGKQIISTDDDNYLIIGIADTDDDLTLEIIKIDHTLGTEIWRARFPNASAYITSIEDPALILRTKETEESEEYYIAAIQMDDLMPTVLAFKIDQDGSLQWINEYIGNTKGSGYRLQSLANEHRGAGFFVGVDVMFTIGYDGTPVQQLEMGFLDNQVLNEGGSEDLIAYSYEDALYVVRYVNTTVQAIYKITSTNLNYIYPNSIFYVSSTNTINLCVTAEVASNSNKICGFITLNASTGAIVSSKHYEAKTGNEWINVSSMITQPSGYIYGDYYVKGLSEYESTDDDKLFQLLSVNGLGEVDCDYDLALTVNVLSGSLNVEEFTYNGFEEYPEMRIPDGISTEQITILEACEDGDEDPTQKIALNINGSDSEAKFSIYPNPAADYLYISFNVEEEDNIEISMYNYLGKKVYQNNNPDNRKLLSLSLSEFASGTYLVKIKVGNEVKQEKVILVK